MALSKLAFLSHLNKALPNSGRLLVHAPPRAYVPIRLFAFATPEEAAADRRKRKRRFSIEPPLSALRRQQHQQPRPAPSLYPQNPNAPRIPELVSVLTGSRLNLHNKILKLIRENDLEEAALLTRHSIYSNCRPTIYTCNSVMAAQLRQSKYADLLSLHRFITQAGVAANIVTYNLLLTVHLDCKRTDLALELYRQFMNDAPFNPSPTTYRVLIKGLVDNQQVEKALEIKDEMEARFKPDPTIYSYLMSGQAEGSNAEGIFQLYEELKQKIGSEEIFDGVVHGNLMKGYFLKGMAMEAMVCYGKVVGEGSPIKMSPVAYNYVLEALSKHGKFEEALKLFEKMKNDHDPPRKLTVNLGSYNVIVDGYCAEKSFTEAIQVFNSMGEKKCSPDILSYNVLIDQLCSNHHLAQAEELYMGMVYKEVVPDEYTFVTMMDACLRENRPDDAATYFKTMVESKCRPNLSVYNRLMEGLVKVGKIDEARSLFELMVQKLRMNDDAYKFIVNALLESGRPDEVLKIIGGMLRVNPNDFTEEVEDFVRDGLRKIGREDEVTNVKSDIEKEKAEAVAKAVEEAERASASARSAVAYLSPPKLLGNNDAEEESGEAVATEVILSLDNVTGEESAETEGDLAGKQVTA